MKKNTRMKLAFDSGVPSGIHITAFIGSHCGILSLLPDSPCERQLSWGRASILSDDRQSIGGALCAPQYSWSKISTISPMTPSSQWHSTRAPQSFTSWVQLAGAKGMTDLASMGMSFWLSPTQ